MERVTVPKTGCTIVLVRPRDHAGAVRGLVSDDFGHLPHEQGDESWHNRNYPADDC